MRVRQSRVVVDGVLVPAAGLRWWQVEAETDRTHRGIFRRVLLMVI